MFMEAAIPYRVPRVISSDVITVKNYNSGPTISAKLTLLTSILYTLFVQTNKAASPGSVEAL